MGTVTLRWLEASLMVGTDSNGHSIVIGRSPENHSEFAGMKPSDLLLLATASCSAYDVVNILTKQRQPLNDLKVLCYGEQQPNAPNIFTRIHLHYIASGGVDIEKLDKAIRLSEDKYCSVIGTLRLGVPVTSDYELVT